MKKTIRALLFITGLLLAGCGGRADIEFERDTFNFGIVQEGALVDCLFTFTNTGTTALSIIDVEPECGCTLARNWDIVVAQGKSGKIPVTFDSSGQQGMVTKTVTVLTNAPHRKKVKLVLEGVVDVPGLEIRPVSLFLAEVTRDTQSIFGSFQITGSQGQSLIIQEVIAPEANMKHTLRVLEPGRKYKLDFAVFPPYGSAETVAKKFTVRTNLKQWPEISLYYSYRVEQAFQVFPAVLRLPSAGAEGGTELAFHIRSNQGLPVRVENLSVANGRGTDCRIEEVQENRNYKGAVSIPAGYRVILDEPTVITFRIKDDPADRHYSVAIQPQAEANQ